LPVIDGCYGPFPGSQESVMYGNLKGAWLIDRKFKYHIMLLGMEMIPGPVSNIYRVRNYRILNTIALA
jgi:hypothetical protein